MRVKEVRKGGLDPGRGKEEKEGLGPMPGQEKRNPDEAIRSLSVYGINECA